MGGSRRSSYDHWQGDRLQMCTCQINKHYGVKNAHAEINLNAIVWENPSENINHCKCFLNMTNRCAWLSSPAAVSDPLFSIPWWWWWWSNAFIHHFSNRWNSVEDVDKKKKRMMMVFQSFQTKSHWKSIKTKSNFESEKCLYWWKLCAHFKFDTSFMIIFSNRDRYNFV